MPRQQLASEGQKQADRTDVLWAQMQSTLEEVDLSAVNGTHVFGAEHSKVLEDLRTAQIALAQAWARSEADDAVDTADRDGKALRASGMLGSEGKSALDGTEGAKSTINSGSVRPGSSGADKNASKLEEETDTDILLARKRREANDKYFQRVNSGVLEVVAKLEEVSVAMMAVEQESRDIWGDTESSVTGGNA
jgi:septum formation topological specificity factor MinE